MNTIGIVVICTLVAIAVIYIWYLTELPPFNSSSLTWKDPRTGQKTANDQEWAKPDADNPLAVGYEDPDPAVRVLNQRILNRSSA